LNILKNIKKVERVIFKFLAMLGWFQGD